MQSSSRRFNYWLCRAIVVSCLFPAAAPLRAEEQIINDEVITKWKSFERFSRSLQGVARRTVVRNGKEERSHFLFKQNQNCVRRCDIDEQKSTEECQFTNAHYAAIVRRNAADRGGFVLLHFTDDPQSGFPGMAIKPTDWVLPAIAPHFCFGRTPLSKFVVDPYVRIQKVSRISENSRELIRIDFNASSDIPKVGGKGEETGWVILDPSRCFCVVRRKASGKLAIKDGRNSITDHEFEYETVAHPSGFPLVKRVTAHEVFDFAFKGKKTKETLHTTIDYEWEVNDTVPDSEFTLTAFGLPEPGSEPVKKSIPLYVWILVAAGVCAALALGFRYLAHRRARTQPTG